jgi:hypothetical protein
MPAADKTLAEAAPEPTATAVPEPVATGAEYEPLTPVPGPEPAASLPPPNGAPPAARAATLLATPAPGIGAPARARMMAAMQQTVGTARVGAMLQAAPAPAAEEVTATAGEAAPAAPPAGAAPAPAGPAPAPGAAAAEEPGVAPAEEAPPAPARPTPEAPVEPQAAAAAEEAPAPPRAPEADPAFQATAKRIRAVARRQRAHQPAPVMAKAAQAAAPPPENQVRADAGARQVGRMGEEQAQLPPFNRAAFKQRVLERIQKVGPKNPVEARQFSSSPQLGSLKSELTVEVAKGKAAAQGDLRDKATPPPDARDIKEKPVQALGPVGVGPAPADPGAAQAAPKPLAEDDVSGPMIEGNRQLDDQMAAAEVTDEQLAAANEPSFTAAVQAKQEARAHAQQASQTFRQEEAGTLAQAQQQAAGTALEQTQAMHAARGQSLTGVRSRQTVTKRADEKARATIADHLEGIYNRTSQAVQKHLSELDREVDQTFQGGVEAARKAFEDYVEEQLDERYSGFWGKANWVDDKLLTWGLPPAVARIFERGRQRYIAMMDVLLNQIAAIVEMKLTAAMVQIAVGRRQIAAYVAGLDESLQTIGKEAAEKIRGRFNELEQGVISKRDQLIDDLAQRYRENVEQLDARIEELRAKHRGLLSKAFDAVVGVIKTILELKNMLLNVLARIADVVWEIIAHPISFLGNLVSGIRLGLSNFISNIASHLQQAFMSWLFGAIQGAGIQLPEQLDFKGILSIALQILGLTYQAIRARAVKLLGEELVSTLERVAEPFIVLVREGPAGLWEWIKEQLSDLKDKVIGEIKDFLITRVVKAGITWILSLLNPASAFIRACKLIYDIVIFFVERGRQILDLVNAVIDAVAAIARGSLEGAAKLVENALAKALPVILGFLASLLNLGGISDKIREVIDKLRAPVTKAVDWVITKAVALVKAGGKLLGFGKKDAPAPGKQAPADSEEVAVLKVRVGEELRQRMPKPVSDAAQVQSVVTGVHGRFRTQGLKSLEVVGDKDNPSEFSILAAASTPTNVLEFIGKQVGTSPEKIESALSAFSSETHIFVELPDGTIDRVVNPGRAADHVLHAEDVLLAKLANEWLPRFKKPRGESLRFVFRMNRSTCSMCTLNVITVKKDLDRRYERHVLPNKVDLVFLWSSVYMPSSPKKFHLKTTMEHIQMLHNAGIELGVWDIWEVIQQKSDDPLLQGLSQKVIAQNVEAQGQLEAALANALKEMKAKKPMAGIKS